MKAIGGPGNGIFECVQDVVGYTNLCYLSVNPQSGCSGTPCTPAFMCTRKPNPARTATVYIA